MMDKRKIELWFFRDLSDVQREKLFSLFGAPAPSLEFGRPLTQAQQKKTLEHILASRGKEWRCFHCDEVFTDERCARLHFGGEESALPACQIKAGEGGLVEAIRRAEKDASDAWFAIHHETTDAAKGYAAQAVRHREQLREVEQLGYDRAIEDIKAHPETVGLAHSVHTLEEPA